MSKLKNFLAIDGKDINVDVLEEQLPDEYGFPGVEDYYYQLDDIEEMDFLGLGKKARAKRLKRKIKRKKKKYEKAVKKGKTKKAARLAKKIAKKDTKLVKVTKKIEKKEKKKAARKAERKTRRAQRKEIRKKYKGAERRQKMREWRAEHGTGLGRALQKVGLGVKKVGLSVPRGAFLAITRLNGLGIASRLAAEKDKNSSKWTSFSNKWYAWGGSRKSLKKAVDKGKKKKALLAKIKKTKGADGEWVDTFYFDADGLKENLGVGDYLYPTGIEEVAALITAASPLIISVFKNIGKPKEVDAETEAALGIEAEALNEAMKAGLAYEKENPLAEEDRDVGLPYENVGQTPKWIWLVGGLIGAGIVATSIFLIVRKMRRR
jgi:hypothetical protein